MQLRDSLICSGCIILAILFIVGAGMQLDPINRQRENMGLIKDTPENIPPTLAYATIATGAFRGLVVDVLWIRADKLKEEGQFFDARQLAELITILQPRFTAVWSFHAWNMAYNISVAIPASEYEQRWQWVKNGYELLRDEAIGKYKLNDLLLYKELGRIFQHKIGGITDDAHKYYKLELALSLWPLLQYSDGSAVDNEYFDKLVDAPQSWEQLTSDPNMITFIDSLKSADDNFEKEEDFVENYLSLRQNSNRFKPEAGRVIDTFRGTKTLKTFDFYAKSYQLRKKWKLDPEFMREINKTYGPVNDWNDPNNRSPLDWRHPDVHAIYWIAKGLKIAAQEESRQIDLDELNTDRMISHSLKNLFSYGKIFIDRFPVQVESEDMTQEPRTEIGYDIYLRPDLRMFQSYNESFHAILKKYQSLEDKGSYESLETGHRNMLINALLQFYQSGQQAQAQVIYDEIREKYQVENANIPLAEFARTRLLEELSNLDLFDAREQIIALMFDSYYLYSMGDDVTALGRENMAEKVYNYYMATYSDEERLSLPPLNKMKFNALVDFMNDERFTTYYRDRLINRIRIERPELYKKLITEAELLQSQTLEE